jgi:hypothetical protein
MSQLQYRVDGSSTWQCRHLLPFPGGGVGHRRERVIRSCSWGVHCPTAPELLSHYGEQALADNRVYPSNDFLDATLVMRGHFEGMATWAPDTVQTFAREGCHENQAQTHHDCLGKFVYDKMCSSG